LTFRAALFLSAMALMFVDGLRWVVLPGRFVLEVLGAEGPHAGRVAVVISGGFYAAAALLAAVRRRESEPAGVVALELAG
jgi:hypothetical protein